MTANLTLIDLDHLDRYVEGDTILRDEILGIFEENAANWLAELDPSSDDQAWKMAAHKLKGAARGIGAWRVGEACASAEKLLGAEIDVAARQSALADIRSAVDAAVSELRAFRNARAA